MKKIFLLIITCIFMTGCLNDDSMQGIDIYTTAYPIEYITKELYKDNGTTYSIYPDDVDIDNYTLTNKQITDYSKSDLFIYNGVGMEKDYAVKLLNKNNNIKIIDSSAGMEYSSSQEELWLDPSNLLMLSRNIKNGFDEYISDPYLKIEIEENYEQVKINISELDAELKLLSVNASDKTLVVSNDVFLFLNKYGFNVISLDPDTITDKKISDVKKLFQNKSITYLYVKANEVLSEQVSTLISENSITTLPIHMLSNLSSQERKDKQDYISIMNSNIEQLKKELH